MLNDDSFPIYASAQKAWRQKMDDHLREENSWLALAGLYWLVEGENTFGTDPDNDFILQVSSGPKRVGSFRLVNGEVKVYIEEDLNPLIDGEKKHEAVLRPDSSGSPTEIKIDHLTFMLLEREDGLAIRLWDNLRPERLDFPGRRWMPLAGEFRIKGKYQRYESEKEIVFSRKNGGDYCTSVQGEIKFDLYGTEYCLVAFEQEDGFLFTLFNDQTNGKETYLAGRFLLVNPPEAGQVEIDFNRAYNPPCAFTDFATCPLPPAQNQIQAAVQAGERA